MNKTININLGGVFFHIDEIAYQKLKGYLDAIRRSLSDDPQGRDEIITDIETRIGELLSDKIKDVRQVVNESDIEEVIEVMGRNYGLLAAQTAQRNVTLNRLADRVLVAQGDAEKFMDFTSDLVISNIHYAVMKNLINTEGFLQKKHSFDNCQTSCNVYQLNKHLYYMYQSKVFAYRPDILTR